METLLQSLTGYRMPRDFARQRNARALAKAKIPRVIVKPVLAQPDADFRRADVRGFGDDVLGRQHAVRFVIVQNPAGKGKMSVLAIKHVVQTHDALVQRAGNDDDLERRARFHHIADDAVAARVGG